MTGTAMSAVRFWSVNAAIAAIVGGSFACIALDAEYWPFSQYPMYSERVRPGPMSDLQLVGVVENEPGHEVAFKSPSSIRPFDWVRLRKGLSRMLERSEEARLHAALQDLLVRYEARRAAGRSHRPRLQALRLYRLWWDDASPRTPRTAERMSRRELLAEAARPAGAQ